MSSSPAGHCNKHGMVAGVGTGVGMGVGAGVGTGVGAGVGAVHFLHTSTTSTEASRSSLFVPPVQSVWTMTLTSIFLPSFGHLMPRWKNVALHSSERTEISGTRPRKLTRCDFHAERNSWLPLSGPVLASSVLLDGVRLITLVSASPTPNDS
jgi:hypothetical protein